MIKSFLFVFVFFSANLFSQNYIDRIQNDLCHISLDFPIDSVLKYKHNFYRLNFNFYDELVKKTFNECMESVDKTGLLDSIIITTEVGRITGTFNIYIGENVPYKVSQKVISFYSDKKLEGFKVVLVKDNPFAIKFGPPSHKREITIRGGQCPYSFINRYVSQKENLFQLLSATSQTSFISIFTRVDERKREYLDKMKNLESTTLIFSGCEKIESMEERVRCSNKKLEHWMEENITKSIEFEPSWLSQNRMGLDVDENGKVFDLRCSMNIDSAKKKEFKKVFLTMPPWNVPTRDGVKRKSVKSILLNYSPLN